MDSAKRIRCAWCQGLNPAHATACQACGAPLDIRNVVNAAGWRAAPRLRDMTEIHFGNSTCQVEGEIVPVAEIGLGEGDAVYFEPDALVWKEDSVLLTVMPFQAIQNRFRAGQPYALSLAYGLGRVAFSRDEAGEVVVLPMPPATELDVREHALLLASQEVEYTFTLVIGLSSAWTQAQGAYLDQFVTADAPGFVLLHGYGNVFQRSLADNESILVEPGAFLYKDASVTLEPEILRLGTGLLGAMTMPMARLIGPGRVGIQSMYQHHETS
jgi:uncharacterized protein (AIM24 family)